MAPPEFQRTEEFAAIDWRDECVTNRNFRTGSWSFDAAAGAWPDEAREHVARSSRRYRSAEEAVAAWTAESRNPLQEEFDELAEIWRRETAGAPFVVTRVTHWAYQRIIGMGPGVVPLILKDLEQHPDHWYWALNAITGEDPAESVLGFQAAATRWCEWGREAGLLT